MTKNDTEVPSYQEGSKFPWVIGLEARDKFRLWLRYSDGTEGVVDLSDIAHTELFTDWQKPHVFEQVVIGEYGDIFWTEEAVLCADSLYLELIIQSTTAPCSWS